MPDLHAEDFGHNLTQDSFIKGREPCPYRVVDDCGGAFAMGAVFGGTFHFIKGALLTPRNSCVVSTCLN